MSKKTITITTCDKCKRELTGRLTYRTCPICHKDICLACIDKENAKLAAKAHPPAVPAVAATVVTLPAVDDVILFNGIVSHFTIHVPTEEQPCYTASIGKHNYEAETVRACVNGLLSSINITLDEVKAAPDSQGKKEILAIMEEQ